MATCTYSKHVWGLCGPSVDNPAILQCVNITECTKNVKGHLKSYNVWDSSINSEARLLLARAGLFETEDVYRNLTICPYHRDTFGLRWRSNRKTCSCPDSWAAHSRVKGERGITLAQSRKLFQMSGIVIPVGSLICTQCRKRLDETVLHVTSKLTTSHSESSACAPEAIQETDVPIQIDENTLKRKICDNEEVLHNDDTEGVSALSESLIDLTIKQDASMYIPEDSSSSEASDTQLQEENLSSQRLYLNAFLESCNIDKISVCRKRWEETTKRTQKSHVIKARDVVIAALNVITPRDAALLWESLKTSKIVEEKLGCNVELPSDKKYIEALAETYENASSWDTKRQVLSIMADLLPFKRLKEYLPGITEYRMKIARHHKLVHGRGVPLSPCRSTRMKVEGNQLDHFLTFITSPHIVQDLPFGQKYLKLSSGEVLETPNVIRAMIPERIVKQYKQYCEEVGFQPFGRTTMLNILSACSATVRKSLQGLDYIAAEGSKAFDNLCLVVKHLEEYGALARDAANNWGSSLKNAKQYLKSDYKVHILATSPVPDHCSTYALSDEKEASFSRSCQHQHDQACSQCEELKEVLANIQDCLDGVHSLDEDVLVDLRYTTQRAVEDVHSWKAHQLRSTRQDMARIDVLSKLEASSVLITQDWAMKFLPQKFRESQTDWFAKRGISWHISVVARKKEEELQSQAFVHIIENCNQDASTVVRIIEHVLLTLKKENDEIQSAYLRQDNAGCYHSSVMLAACRHMYSKTGVRVCRVDFSDPQGGKGPCDRKAATIKAHVRRYINEGHDVTNAQDFYNAITSAGGVSGVRVAFVDASTFNDVPKPAKWGGVSMLNNFAYSGAEITVWRAYDVGDGVTIKEEQLQVEAFTGTFQQPFSTGNFNAISSKEQNISRKQMTVEQLPISPVQLEDINEPFDCELFQCPNAGCVKVYQKHCALENHLSYGKCELHPERDTLLDKAKSQYHVKLVEGTSVGATIQGSVVTQECITNQLAKGWALKSTRKTSRFSESQKKYLDEKFDIGQQTGHKLDPATVARDMRYAKNKDRTRLFEPSEFLSAQQVQSYFSRQAAKLRCQTVDFDSEDEAAAKDQQQYSDTRSVVVTEVELQHPITCDNYNLCALYHSNKLNELSVAMLKFICKYLDLRSDSITTRRKAPYIALLNKLIEGCTCCSR